MLLKPDVPNSKLLSPLLKLNVPISNKYVLPLTNKYNNFKPLLLTLPLNSMLHKPDVPNLKLLFQPHKLNVLTLNKLLLVFNNKLLNFKLLLET